MPSNQCTNSLMELSFAVGNMIGAEQCDVNDWRQIRDQLASWECSDRGKAGEALALMQGTVTTAIRHCESRTGNCLESDCHDLFENHEELAQALNVYDPLHIGRGYRGALPPKIKGAEGLERSLTLAQQREEEGTRVKARKEAEEVRVKGESTLRKQERDRLKAEADAKKKADADAKKEADTRGVTGPALPEGSRYARPSRGMGYGDEERRERWYPARV